MQRFRSRRLRKGDRYSKKKNVGDNKLRTALYIRCLLFVVVRDVFVSGAVILFSTLRHVEDR